MTFVAMMLAYVAAFAGFVAIGVIGAFVARDVPLFIYVLPVVSLVGAALVLSNARMSRILLASSAFGWLVVAFFAYGFIAFAVGLANGVAAYLSAAYPEASNADGEGETP
jgi:hypothetical protein